MPVSPPSSRSSATTRPSPSWRTCSAPRSPRPTARSCPEEQAVLNKLADGLGIDEARANKLLAQFDEDAAAEK